MWLKNKIGEIGVDFQIKEIDTKKVEVEGRRFGESYTPKFGDARDIQPGSMDASDNEVADLEHGEMGNESEPLDPDQELNDLDHEKAEWEDDLNILKGERGNEEDKLHLVIAHAGKERERREKLEQASVKPQT
jgi:hypothetical protein